MIYKLWMSGEVVGEWNDSASMQIGVRDYLEANPDTDLLNLTGYASTMKYGARPAFSLKGEEIASYLDDVEE